MALPLQPGRRFGPYLVEATIGEGGMGSVMRARHVETGAVHAVKVITARTGSDPTRLLARFRREVEVLARLPVRRHLVRLYACGVEEGRPWCSMDYVEGRSLADRLREGALPPVEAAVLVAKLARAVADVHAHDVVHRDIKPENVILTPEGEPHLVDFGLAFDAFAEQLTHTGQVLGTPAYMAPEQVNSRTGTVGPATDVYGLGATLYAALTAEPPFGAKDSLGLLADVLRKPPRSIRKLAPNVPRDAEAICLRALRKRPQDRYPRAAALADDLDRFIRGESAEAARTSLGDVARRGRAVAAAGGVIVALILGTSAAVFSGVIGGEPPERRLTVLERFLDAGEPLADDEVAALEALAADERVAGDAALARRARVARLLAHVLATEPSSVEHGARARELAAAVRRDGAIDRPLMSRAVRVLQRGGRTAALAAVLHASPAHPAPPEAAAGLARAIARPDGGRAAELLAPPTDEAAFKALLRAPGIPDAVRGGLLLRRAEQRFAADPPRHDEAIADLVDALTRHGVSLPRGGLPAATHLHALRAFLQLAASDDGDLTEIRTLSDLIIRSGDPDLAPSVADVIAFQQAAGLAGYLDTRTTDLGPDQAERVLEAKALLDAHNRLAHAPGRTGKLREVLGLDRFRRLGDAERQRPADRRNAARLLYLGAHLVEVGESEPVSAWVEAALAAGVEGEVWSHIAAYRLLRSTSRREAAIEHARRGVELDRERPAQERVCYLPMVLAGSALDLDEKARWAAEAYQVTVGALGRIDEFRTSGGLPPWGVEETAEVGGLLRDVSRELIGRRELPCCGRDEAAEMPDVDALLAGSLAMARRPEAAGGVLTADGEALTIGSVLEARAAHHLRHDRNADALADANESLAISRTTSFEDPRWVRVRIARLHTIRAIALDALGRRDEARAAREDADRARR